MKLILIFLILTTIFTLNHAQDDPENPDQPQDPEDPPPPPPVEVEEEAHEEDYSEAMEEALDNLEDEIIDIVETISFDPVKCVIDPPPTLQELDAYYKWMDDYEKKWKDAKQRMCKMIRVIYNLRNIKKHNAEFKEGKQTFERKLSFASDLTPDEKKRKFLTKMKDFNWRSLPATILRPPFPRPRDFVNYTADGLISTPVKDQWDCGSCYAFAAINALEAQVRRCGITREPLSIQAIVDCATLGVWGCSSGWPFWSYRWMMSSGIMTEKSYPYTARQGQCQYNASQIVGYVDQAFNYYGTNATFMAQAVSAVGPVAVVFCVDDSLFSYSSGVYDIPSCCQDIQHAVTIVGYGTDPVAGPYWIVKNSWGSNWGEQGFFRIARGKNLCNMEFQFAYASVRRLNGVRC